VFRNLILESSNFSVSLLQTGHKNAFPLVIFFNNSILVNFLYNGLFNILVNFWLNFSFVFLFLFAFILFLLIFMLYFHSLSVGFVGDDFYPQLTTSQQDNYQRPLQLLARSLRFIDPLTGQLRLFSSARQLTNIEHIAETYY